MGWFKRIKNTYKYDISLKTKLLYSYVILIIIPLLILGGILYMYYLNTYIKQASDFSNQLTQQINNNIESYFKNIEELSINIAYDSAITKIIDSPDVKESKADEESITDTLYHYLMSTNGVNSIHIYTSEYNYHAYKKGTINKYYSPAAQDYLEKAKTTYGRSFFISGYDKQFNENFFSISIVRPILSLYNFNVIGVVVINIGYNVFDDLIKDLEFNSNNKVFILNEKDQVLYSADKALIGKKLAEDLYYKIEYNGNTATIYDENNQKFLFISQRSTLTSHRSVVMVPYSDFTKSVKESSIIILYLGFIIFFISFFLAIIIANTITKPIRDLKDRFNYVGKPNNLISKRIKGKNEISELWLGFNKMVLRIDELLAETISKENEKRKAEIKALQMQINPHFLYNTLNSIKYLSIIQNADNINRITNLLISLLKELANNQTDYTTIRDEINMVKQYIEIQKVIYMDKFSVSIVCPIELYEIKILKFLLQPIVENSIFHGILPNEKKGQIRIKIIKEDKLIIKIIDNGIGLDSNLDLEKESQDGQLYNHIGLQNINNRIKLFYGDEYGIVIKSKKNLGTVVLVVLPYQIM